MKRMLIALAAVAFLAVAAAANAADVASPPAPAPALLKRPLKTVPRYKLSAQQAAGLPLAIALNGQQGAIIGDAGRPSGGGDTTPKLKLLNSQPPQGSRFFLVQGEWLFTAERGFQQTEPGGNRLLLLPDGTAEVFNGDGRKIGSFQDPVYLKLHGELLKLTM